MKQYLVQLVSRKHHVYFANLKLEISFPCFHNFVKIYNIERKTKR